MNPKKLLAMLLALLIAFSALPTAVWAADVEAEPQAVSKEECWEDTSDDTLQDVSEDDFTDASDGIIEDVPQEALDDSAIISDAEASQGGGISIMSLLPLQERIGYVTINRIDYITEELVGKPQNSLYVYEALGSILTQYGVLNSADEHYDGVIMWSYNNDNYEQVAWNDIITLSSSSDSIWFILDDGDQLNPENVRYNITITINGFESAFMEKTSVGVYNDAGESVSVLSQYRYWNSSVAGRYYSFYKSVSDMTFAKDEIPGVLLSLPEGYSAESITVYNGMYYSANEIAQVEAEDVTAQILGFGESSQPYKIDQSYHGDNYYSKSVTIVITIGENGKIVIPTNIVVYSSANSINILFRDKGSNKYATTPLYDENGSYNNHYGYNTPVYNYGRDFESIESYLSAYYNDYFDPDSSGRNPDRIKCAFIGNYTSFEDAQTNGAQDIKEELFSINGHAVDFLSGDDGVAYTSDGCVVDTKTLYVTIIDVYENIYNLSYSIGVLTELKVNLSFNSEDDYSKMKLYSETNGSYSLMGSLPVYKYGNSFTDIHTSLSAAYYDSVIDRSGAGSRNLDIIAAAYIGNFSSSEEAQSANATDIKESLFTPEGINADFSQGEDSIAYTANFAHRVWIDGYTLNWIDEGVSNYVVYAYIDGSILNIWQVGKTTRFDFGSELPTHYLDKTISFIVYSYGMLGSATYNSGNTGSGFDDSSVEKVNLKTIHITAIDTYGIVYNMSYSVGIMAEPGDEQPEKPDKPITPSDGTYLTIDGAVKEPEEGSDYAPNLNTYKVRSSDDSYYKNGYQTLFVLDGNQPYASDTIVPTFTTSTGARAYAGLDVANESMTSALRQYSGKSQVPFRSGEPILYSAAAESGNHYGNYWVTYVTRQSGGSKLFVNATNYAGHYIDDKPSREIFYNDDFGYNHDILFANIGDEELTGIKVELKNAKGVMLDPYWTVLDSSIAKLAPFTSTNPPYSNANGNRLVGELNNIAKIRLLPSLVYQDVYGGLYVENGDSLYNQVREVSYFGEISGTLVISADDNDPVEIVLTGIAGTPKIVTEEIIDGVKYVPYSSMIQTNSMYGTGSMKFSVIDGTLPKGIELLPNGELYGIPAEFGDFTFTVETRFVGTAPGNIDISGFVDTREFTITIKENTDENVDAVNGDAQGYQLTDKISKYVTIYYRSVTDDGLPVIEKIEVDSDLFRSEGSYTTEFKAFYIDSIKLVENVDYYAEEGSTKITILAEAFSHVGLADGNIAHTLAAEFRTSDEDLKRSAQNVYLEYVEYKKQEQNNTGTTNPNYPTIQYPLAPNSYVSVNAVMVFVDSEGNSLTNLSLELHSDVKYAIADVNGFAVFNNVEFGRHTLYLTDLATNTTVSKTFTIVSGFDAGLNGDIITAEIGETIYITIVYDGNSLTLYSATLDIDVPQEGSCNEEETEFA